MTTPSAAAMSIPEEAAKQVIGLGKRVGSRMAKEARVNVNGTTKWFSITAMFAMVCVVAWFKIPPATPAPAVDARAEAPDRYTGTEARLDWAAQRTLNTTIQTGVASIATEVRAMREDMNRRLQRIEDSQDQKTK